MKQNTHTDLAEIAGGKLAVQRAASKDVRQTGATIESDHQQVLAKVKDFANTKGLTLPNHPNTMQQKHAKLLKQLHGSAFDTKYVTVQIAGHKKSITHTKKEIQTGTSPKVVSLAQYYLPIAEKHLNLLQHDKAVLTGPAPSSVNTGSGGQAAATGTTEALGVLGGGTALVAFSGGWLLWRRRRT